MGFLWFAFILVLVLLLLSGLYMLSLMAKRKPKAGFHGKLGEYHYAHRGLHSIAAGIPENSLTAFRLAAQHDYGAELDVHLSRDGRLVVMHDESLKRTTGANAKISSVTTEVLDQLRLEGTKEKVPYLEEVLPIFDGKTPLVIEIKTDNGNYQELTRKVCNQLRQHPEITFCMESFDPRVLYWLRRHHPEIVRGQLSCNFIKDRCGLSWGQAVLFSNMMFNFLTRPDFIAYKMEDRFDLAPALCKKLWGVQGFIWTVRSQRDATQLLEEDNLIIFEGFAAK